MYYQFPIISKRTPKRALTSKQAFRITNQPRTDDHWPLIKNQTFEEEREITDLESPEAWSCGLVHGGRRRYSLTVRTDLEEAKRETLAVCDNAVCGGRGQRGIFQRKNSGPFNLYIDGRSGANAALVYYVHALFFKRAPLWAYWTGSKTKDTFEFSSHIFSCINVQKKNTKNIYCYANLIV